jgi:hypothetical protein
MGWLPAVCCLVVGTLLLGNAPVKVDWLVEVQRAQAGFRNNRLPSLGIGLVANTINQCLGEEGEERVDANKQYRLRIKPNVRGKERQMTICSGPKLRS